MVELVLPEATLEDVTRQRAEFESASKHGHPSRDALIRLIWTLVHANNKGHNRDGVKAAEQLLILKADEVEQITYLAAVGEYKLGQYMAARNRLKTILTVNPQLAQAKNLLAAVDDKLMNDTLVAGGVLAAVGGVAAVVVGALLAGSKR